jgi:hypothetical protein
MDAESEQHLATSIRFLTEIGIPVTERQVPEDAFLPGIEIQNGSIAIDREKLRHPGDILHEAGHLAVTPAEKRPTLSSEHLGQEPGHQADEMMAIAWSYAACLHLGIDPLFVFHEEGYKGAVTSILNNLESRCFLGIHALQRLGLTFDEWSAASNGVAPYPHMVHWLRESADSQLQ